MKKVFLAFLLFFLLCGFAFAISSNEAVNFVVKENSFLLEGENFQSPVSPLRDSKGSYWVIPVLSGGEIVTYFPVKENSKELSVSRATNRDLFKAADFLRELGIEKSRVSAAPSVDWVFTPSYTLVFNTLSLSLNSEVFQVNTIASTLNDSQVNQRAGDLKERLSKMSEKSTNISLFINDAVKAESSFNSDPAVVKVNDLKEKFSAVFSELSSLNEMALSYRTEINKLKELISVSGEDASTKTYLILLADPPPEFNSIGNYVLDATEVSSGLESVYARVDSHQDALLDTFDSRLERNTVFNLLYSENEVVLGSTDKKFSSLKVLVDFILLEQNRPYWNAKSSLAVVESDWDSAQKAFNQGSYQDAEFSAKKALSEALKVYNQGLVQGDTAQPVLSEELIFQIVTALVVLLVLVFLYNNRDKLKDFVSPRDEEKEVELRGF